ncbi:MAG: translational GTPase TypA [Rickettsiaceae bacterium]|nr:translational GTPase TypA [Rickettsiaceae bacterium]MDP4832443.1 translational GTPase TypA [Rickettsiaceae bacterium]MDP5020421.1 translational GTPase TypA [Rickettsiaceae bacterium]MDP5083545.1 translational GTPase TypA [Rickettsiaceae bacterium]
MTSSIRNIAIIAHVDHGKTTLIDNMLKQSGLFRENQAVEERAMDSNDLEKERGITILAKCTSVMWKDTKVNIIDTPGHADFGGEVERILSMVDGVVLLVDAAEGPMPQTKFVLGKALKLGLKPIVVINKIDRSDARSDEVLDEIFDLFVSLDATDAQLDFPVIYASGRSGWAVNDLNDPRENLDALFDMVLAHVEKPKSDIEAPFSMIVTTREYDSYLGRILTGRIESGVAKINMPIKVMSRDGKIVESGRISKMLTFKGLERLPVEEAVAGDIIALAGLEKANVADTIAAPEVETPLEAQPIDPPTLSMTFSINNSPLAGREGDKLTSRVLRARLMREVEGNVAIKITETDKTDAFNVAGRGELQLGVLIETMRREGFELSISRPSVLFKNDPDTNEKLEPMEEVQIDVDSEYVGTVVESMNLRKAQMKDMRETGAGKTRLLFIAPSRGLIGYHGPFLTETRGTGVMSRIFHSYGPYTGKIDGRRNGVLISMEDGKAVAYALWNLEDRGDMFIGTGVALYKGMIIGEHNRDNDLEINPVKAKQLSNVRASGKDEAIKLSPPRLMSLEQALAYIQDDELVEVTPQSIRLRKMYLDPNERKKMSRQA